MFRHRLRLCEICPVTMSAEARWCALRLRLLSCEHGWGVSLKLPPSPRVGGDAAAEHEPGVASFIRRCDVKRQRMKQKHIARGTCALDDLQRYAVADFRAAHEARDAFLRVTLGVQ